MTDSARSVLRRTRDEAALEVAGSAAQPLVAAQQADSMV